MVDNKNVTNVKVTVKSIISDIKESYRQDIGINDKFIKTLENNINKLIKNEQNKSFLKYMDMAYKEGYKCGYDEGYDKGYKYGYYKNTNELKNKL